jgi:two-component system, cell cycle response regulator
MTEEILFDILIVEDDLISRSLLSRTLTSLGYKIIEAGNGQQAWDILQTKNIQLVITDWIMPVMDGLELTRKIRSSQKFSGYVYIVILTGRLGIDNIVDGLDAGADDYLAKPFSPKELSARLKIGQRILDLERRLRGAREQMRILAMHDELTGIWNRRAFYNHATAVLEHAARENHPTSLVMLDIDHFKHVNDSYGHLVGDQVLKMVADTLKDNLRPYDRVGRWGGEEFIALLPTTQKHIAAEIAERLRQSISAQRYTIAGIKKDDSKQLGVQVSIGVASIAGHNTFSLDDLVDRADSMLYQAKGKGRNRVCIEPDTQDNAAQDQRQPDG